VRPALPSHPLTRTPFTPQRLTTPPCSVEEIKKVDAGGNKRGQAVWMARYNPSDGPIPTEGDVEKIRKFLKDK